MANGFTLEADIAAKTDKFTSGLLQCEKKAESFGRKLAAMGEKGSDAFSEISTSVKGVTRDLKQIVQGIVLAQTFYQALSAIKDCTAAVWEYIDALNMAETTFSNLFKSTELAEEFVAVMQDYAAKSPFDFGDVKGAATTLSAYGVQYENLMYAIQGIGNLAAVTGEYSETFSRVATAMGQIYSKGKLQAEEMKQLAEAGLNVNEVYKRLGVSASELSKVPFAEGLNAIVDTMNEYYAGSVAAANTTVQGMIANMKDVMLMTAASILQPAYNNLRSILYSITLEFDKFQSYFREGGLAYAIEQYFGPEVLMRVQQTIAILMKVGETIWAIVVPAFQILSHYGEALQIVFLAFLQIIAPFVQMFQKIVASLEGCRVASRALQAVMLALAAAFVANKVAVLGNMVISALSNLMSGLQAKVQAAAMAQQVYNITLMQTGSAAAAAAAGVRVFNSALNSNKLVMFISLVAALASALLGLRAILGGVTDSFAAMTGIDYSGFLGDIKKKEGELEKFNKDFMATADTADDLNDALDDTKKALEGLLSFDEVFKLPEITDPNKDSGLDDEAYQLPDFGDFEIPKPDLFDWENLWPETEDIFADWWAKIKEWFSNLKWTDIAASLSAGLVSALATIAPILEEKAARLFASVFSKEQLDTMAVALEKNTAERMGRISFKDMFTTIANKFKNLPSTIKNAISRFSFKEAKETLITKLKNIFTGLNFRTFVEGLKAGIKGAFLELAFDFLFDILEEKLDEAGLDWAANAVDNFGNPIASALAVGIVTRNPFAAVGAAVITAIFDSIGEGIDTGDWSGAVTTIISGLGLVMSKKIAGGKIGKLGGFAAIGSLIVDALFGTISDTLAESGDTQGADIADKAGTILSTAMAGLSLGSIFGPVGAAVGAGVGAILGTIMAFWDDISTWWNNDAWPVISDLWQKIQPVLEAIGTVVSNVFDSVGTILSGAWTIISNLFGLIVGIFTGDTDKIQESLGGLGEGVDTVFTGISDFLGTMGEVLGGPLGIILELFSNAFDGIGTVLNGAWEVFSNIFGLIVGIVTGDGDKIQESLNGLSEGIGTIFDGIGGAIQGAYDIISGIFESISNAFQTLADNAPEPLQGLFDLISRIFGGIGDFISTAGDVIGGALDTISGFFGITKDSTTESMESMQTDTHAQMDAMMRNADEMSRSLTETLSDANGNIDSETQNMIEAFTHSQVETEKATRQMCNDAGVNFDDLNKKLKSSGVDFDKRNEDIAKAFKDGEIDSTKATQLMHDNMQQKYRTITQLAQEQPNKISRPFSNQSNLLASAGSMIVGGLKSAMSNAFNGVINMVSSWGKSIAAHKGPESYDKKLLTKNGEWIVEGLQKSLASNFKDVISYVSTIGGSISNAFSMPDVDTDYGMLSGVIDSFSSGIDTIINIASSAGDKIQDAFGIPQLQVDTSGLAIPDINANKYNVSIPSTVTQPTVSQPNTVVEEVANPFIDETSNGSLDANRPIVYVHTMIADKQGLRNLKKELDIIDQENNRWS